MIPLFKVFMAPDAAEHVAKVLQSGYIGQGAKVEEFEQKLQEYLGASHVVTLNSGTSALHLALRLIKTHVHNAYASLAPKTEILTTPLTCTATNFPILANGLKPRWVDVDPETCNIDIGDLRRKISRDTLAIMVVHWGGYPCDLNGIAGVQEECIKLYGYKPPIIEDCAHAFGAAYDSKLLGNHGNYCCFSFQAIKHLTAGDGGLLVCPDAPSYQRAVLLRWYGLDRTSTTEMRCVQNVQEWGFKFHMNDINAAIGLANLPHIEQILAKHRSNGAFYEEELAGTGAVELLKYHSNRDPAYWMYTIRVRKRLRFVRWMRENGITVSRVHDRNDKHDCLREFRSILPGTDQICDDMICIPSGWWVSEEDRAHVVATIRKGW